jgi:hypothetical protein
MPCLTSCTFLFLRIMVHLRMLYKHPYKEVGNPRPSPSPRRGSKIPSYFLCQFLRGMAAGLIIGTALCLAVLCILVAIVMLRNKQDIEKNTPADKPGLPPSMSGLPPSMTGLPPSMTGLPPSMTGLPESASISSAVLPVQFDLAGAIRQLEETPGFMEIVNDPGKLNEYIEGLVQEFGKIKIDENIDNMIKAALDGKVALLNAYNKYKERISKDERTEISRSIKTLDDIRGMMTTKGMTSSQATVEAPAEKNQGMLQKLWSKVPSFLKFKRPAPAPASEQQAPAPTQGGAKKKRSKRKTKGGKKNPTHK